MSRFSFESSPLAPASAVVSEGDFRLTVLSDRLIRMEKGSFTDEATQTVWNRNFPETKFSMEKRGNIWLVETECCQFHIDINKCSVKRLFINGESIFLTAKNTLPGTARTLDMTNGKVKMGRAIVSKNGVSFLDDSGSLILRQDGKIYPRKKCRDIYVFAYGKEYRACINAFYKLTEYPPLIPKFALGNWWSRYKAYTQNEYMELMEEFDKRDIPLTVATIDMDWHWTNVIERFGKKAAPAPCRSIYDYLYAFINPGWTGYSWNTELFPDRVKFLDWLHKKGLAVTLNVHPSQGVRFFEDSYADMCRHMGLSGENESVIEFDLTDENFAEAYFDVLHHPMEEEGVDFWWIDWQQGTKSRMKGLDPLWALNHYHSIDKSCTGKRPLILSRYAGWGSHRYPLGFSGDTVCSWKSLALQPFFTSSAANAGYTWWSHDIGGHYKGINDDELYIRWLQFGVFSPINRLHSSNNECMGKEPWKRGYTARTVAEKFLRLRHRLIPYIYSANYLTHSEGRALCEPMYYSYDCAEAYEAKNQYLFGTELMVCPIVKPANIQIGMAEAELWLPEGRWTDVFNGRIYEGGCKLNVFRDIDKMPVFAHAGSIVPMYVSRQDNSLENSCELDILIWRGNGTFKLYEDDGRSLNYKKGEYSIIPMTVSEKGKELYFEIGKYDGLCPVSRKVNLHFMDILSADAEINGTDAEFEKLSFDYSGETVTVKLSNCDIKRNPSFEALLTELFTRIQGSNGKKQHMLKMLQKDISNISKLPAELKNAVEELMKLK